MDYEKKYKEALERATQIHSEQKAQSFDVMAKVFPELAESKDEKIRKALIDGFTVMKESKNCGKTFSNHNIPVTDILAWLEKQKSIEYDITLEEFKNAFITKAKQYDINLPNRGYDIHALCKELYELKPKQERIEYNEEEKEMDCRQWVEKHYSSKPFEIKDMIAHGYLAGRVNAYMDAEQSAKEKYKTEWSEEDETGWTNTMIMIKECAANHYTKDSIKLVVDWLESIHHQKNNIIK